MTQHKKNYKQSEAEEVTGEVVDRELGDTDRGFAALSYLGFMSFVAYLIKSNSKFVRFHATQGIGLFAFEVLMLIPLFWILWPLVLVLIIVGAIKAWSGEYWKIPFVHEVGEFIIEKLKLQ